jgi:hypothetical protein
MKAEPQVRGDAWRDFGRQVAAVGIGGVVALFGGFVGFMGALSCLAGCQGLTPGIVVAYAGLGIMAGSPLVISRVARHDGWVSRGTLGIVVGTAAFFLGRGLGALMGFADPPWVIVYPSLGLAAAVALPARDRMVLVARLVGVLALSMVPALLRDGGVFVRFVVHNYPDGSRTSGWEDHGGFLVWLALAGVPAGLFVPMALGRMTLRTPSNGRRDQPVGRTMLGSDGDDLLLGEADIDSVDGGNGTDACEDEALSNCAETRSLKQTSLAPRAGAMKSVSWHHSLAHPRGRERP